MPRAKRLDYTGEPQHKLTHYLFRYPAKFHPRVVRRLLSLYTNAGDTVFDPFCGSGTLLVEALVAGRKPIGCDVDPVAAFVSRTKSKRVNAKDLETILSPVRDLLLEQARPAHEYQMRMHKDLALDTLDYQSLSCLCSYRSRNLADYSYPQRPALIHRGRRYSGRQRHASPRVWPDALHRVYAHQLECAQQMRLGRSEDEGAGWEKGLSSPCARDIPKHCYTWEV